MKRVVMIAYAFPPEGNAGSYRPLRFVRHLPELDWHPTVVTLDSANYERYDPSLLEQVSADIEIIRVNNRDPWRLFQARRSERIQKQLAKGSPEQATRILSAQQNPMRSRARELVRSIEAWCYHPDPAMGWIRPAVNAIAGLRARPNVIWATGGPWSSFIVAQRVSQRTGVPYILDFRDAWTITVSEFESLRPKWATRWDRRTLYGLFEAAHAVIFRYHTEAECYWRAYQGALDISRIHIIPNGYEGEIEQFGSPRGDRCVILYTGTLSSYRYDTLLVALSKFKLSDPTWASKLRLLFVGEGTEILANQARSLDLSDLVLTKAPVAFEQCNALKRQAHALLVLGRPPTIKGYELLAGAKLFDYLRAGLPIIGVLPNDETRKILDRVGVSTIADIDSPTEISAVFRKLLKAWSAGTLRSLVPEHTACESYSAVQQTTALVRALEGIPTADTFTPGRDQIPLSIRADIANPNWANGS